MTNPGLALTIYSLPNCMACRNSKKKAEDLGLPFTEVMLTDGSEEATAVSKFAKDRGLTTAPLIVLGPPSTQPLADRTNVTIWTGFRPDMLEYAHAITAGTTGTTDSAPHTSEAA